MFHNAYVHYLLASQKSALVEKKASENWKFEALKKRSQKLESRSQAEQTEQTKWEFET